MELRFLGTAACLPTVSHSTCGVVLRHGPRYLLYDAPENAQQILAVMGVPILSIRCIVVSHLHLDHCAGLIPLLTSLSVRDPSKSHTVTVVGPVGIKDLVEMTANVTDSVLLPGIRFVEVSQEQAKDGFVVPLEGAIEAGRSVAKESVGATIGVSEGCSTSVSAPAPVAETSPSPNPAAHTASLPPLPSSVPGSPDCQITVFPLNHRIPSLGVLYEYPDQTVFDAVSAMALGVPVGPELGRLNREGSVDVAGRTVTREQCCRLLPGKRVLLCSDNSAGGPEWEACRAFLTRRAVGCDLMLHECTHRCDLASKSVSWGHTSADLALELARQLRPKALVLNHFSNRYGSSPFSSADPPILRLRKGSVYMCNVAESGIRPLAGAELVLANSGLGMDELASRLGVEVGKVGAVESAAAPPANQEAASVSAGASASAAALAPASTRAPTSAPPAAHACTCTCSGVNFLPPKAATARHGPVGALPDLSPLAFEDSRVLRYSHYVEFSSLIQDAIAQRQRLLACAGRECGNRTGEFAGAPASGALATSGQAPAAPPGPKFELKVQSRPRQSFSFSEANGSPIAVAASATPGGHRPSGTRIISIGSQPACSDDANAAASGGQVVKTIHVDVTRRAPAPLSPEEQKQLEDDIAFFQTLRFGFAMDGAGLSI